MRVTWRLDALGYDAVDIGALVGSWRSEPGTPVSMQPYLAERPEGLSDEEAMRWFFETPRVPLRASHLRRPGPGT